MGKGSYGFPGLRNASFGQPKNTIRGNLKSILRRYKPDKDGYIGERAKSERFPEYRKFTAKDPVEAAKRLFRSLGRGGIQKPLPGPNNTVKGWKRTMLNGDVITYRPRESSDGSPVVDINIVSKTSGGLKYQKIHFYSK